MNYLEIIRDREAEISAVTTARITASSDLIRALICEFREQGRAVYRDVDTNVYVFDGTEVEPSATLPKGTFLILTHGGSSE
jgi:hypothetical protein